VCDNRASTGAVHLPLQIKKTEKVKSAAFRNAANVGNPEIPATSNRICWWRIPRLDTTSSERTWENWSGQLKFGLSLQGWDITVGIWVSVTTEESRKNTSFWRICEKKHLRGGKRWPPPYDCEILAASMICSSRFFFFFALRGERGKKVRKRDNGVWPSPPRIFL
jgi:hypothetical protein